MKIELDALYHQVTVGDYGRLFSEDLSTNVLSDGNTVVRCAEQWKILKGTVDYRL